MNDQSEQIKQNFLSQWLRILFMVLFVIFFAIVWEFLGLLLIIFFLIQVLFSLFTGESNRYLRHAATNLGTYFRQVFDFLTYLSDRKPFPFSPFPGSSAPAGSNPPPREETISPAAGTTTPYSDQHSADATASEEARHVHRPQDQNPPSPAAPGPRPPAAVTRLGQEEDDVFADISFTRKPGDEEPPASTEDEDKPRPGPGPGPEHQ